MGIRPRRGSILTTRFVLTGGFGFGKTTILEMVAARGITVVPEFARAILAEQRATGGDGTFEQNRQKFFGLMVARAVDDHERTPGPALFDRGLVDLIAYAEIFELDSSHIRTLAETRRYARTVFFLPPWQEIYTTDDERKATFEQSQTFGVLVRGIYVELGYDVIDVPQDTPETRADLVVRQMLNPGK
jgi:predicted ATPase